MSSRPAAAAAAAAGAGAGDSGGGSGEGVATSPAVPSRVPFYVIVRVIVKGDVWRFAECPRNEALIGSYIHGRLAGRERLCTTHVCNNLPPEGFTPCEAKSTGYDYDPSLDCECLNPELKFHVTFDRFDSREARDASYRGQLAVRKYYESFTCIPDDGRRADLYFYTYDFEPRSVAVATAAAAADAAAPSPGSGVKRKAAAAATAAADEKGQAEKKLKSDGEVIAEIMRKYLKFPSQGVPAKLTDPVTNATYRVKVSKAEECYGGNCHECDLLDTNALDRAFREVPPTSNQLEAFQRDLQNAIKPYCPNAFALKLKWDNDQKLFDVKFSLRFDTAANDYKQSGGGE